MVSNQILHQTIQDIKHISGLECGIWDARGRCLVRTSEQLLNLEAEVQQTLEQTAEQEMALWEDRGFFLVQDEGTPLYLLVLLGSHPQMELVGALCVSNLHTLYLADQMQTDKEQWMQTVLQAQGLSTGQYRQAKKFHIPDQHRRVVFLIVPKNPGENLIRETLQGLYVTGTKDFVTEMQGRFVLVKALDSTEEASEMAQIAREILDTLNTEAMVSVRVAYGTVAADLSGLSKSYQEAEMALEVGQVFYEDRPILAYSKLGIGRLLHALPQSVCELFLQEVFQGTTDQLFTDEELTTVFAFFANNLNISETARQLYIHRNTLVYRLEKIQKKTGLDVRNFEDAVTFQIAIMVSNHVKSLSDGLS